MRTNIWAAALIVALGFTLRGSAAPIILASGGPAQAQPSFFTPLRLPSFLKSSGSFANFFPSIPSIGNANAYATSVPVQMKNGAPTADYFKQFGLQVAPRAQ